jgi:hypothetical protein
MKALWREALDAEPILKYSLLAIRIFIMILFYLVAMIPAIIVGFIFSFFDLISSGSEGAEKNSKWLIDCAIQEQWERDRQ